MASPAAPQSLGLTSNILTLGVFIASAWLWLVLGASGDDAAPLWQLTSQLSWATIFSVSLALVCARLLASSRSRQQRLALEYATRRVQNKTTAVPTITGNAELKALVESITQLGDSLKRSQRELRIEKDRLDRVVTSMQEGVLLLDKDGKVQLINDALRQMLFLGSHVIGRDAVQVLPDAQLSTLLTAALGGENNSLELELAGPQKKQVLANVRRLHKRRGALAVLVDITERRRLETVRQEFVANASHELRTPVAAISSAVETLLGPAAGNVEATKTFLEMIERNAKRLRQLVDDLLELSQLESGRVDVELTALDLKQQVEATLQNHATAARKKGTELSCRILSEQVVMANASGLDHVIGNLVQNAINYCPEASRIILDAHRDEGAITLSIRDNGPGIAPEHRARLFERFYRVDTGRSRHVGGTGLGLAIVKHWMEAMQGSVSISGEFGVGSTFAIKLTTPAPSDAPESPERGQSRSRPPQT